MPFILLFAKNRSTCWWPTAETSDSNEVLVELTQRALLSYLFPTLSWWWTGRPGVLQSMGSQRVGHDWVTELNWTKQRHNKETDLRWSLSPGPPKEAKTKSAGGTKLTLVTEGSGSSMCAKAHPGQSDLWMTLGQVFCSEHLSGTRLSGHWLSTFTMISSCLSILRFWKMTLCAWNQHLVVSISRITKTGRLTGNVLGC